jgi:serine/threonine-protein kinase
VAEFLAAVRAALADRYTIERELGRGGHAIVYLAHDVKHDRPVAIKVLAPERAVRAERFLREIQLSARLTHPRILTLIDSGAADGFLYYVMPYVAGESLRDRLQRESQLPVQDAVRITREVASALDYAHREGVVHRDIKPENILLSGGEAVVADFGIARALTAAGSEAVTGPAVAVGTPAYMSPEQGGGGQVDGRSDVYSLGCVLYEMLAGHPPYAGTSAQETVARHALDPIPTLRAARLAVPRAVERAVARALAKQPVDRFATAAEFARALAAPRRPAPIAAAVGLVILASAGLVVRQALRAPSDHSVAVLPFANLSGDSANEYLSDGVSEELINALVQVEGLRVPARTSSFFFKGKDLTLRQIGESLHVASVLEGSLRKAGRTLRITAQLVNVADGYHLWSETFDRELADGRDLLAVQQEIAQAIARALNLRLGSRDATTLARRPTDDSEAYTLYLQGRFFLNKGTEAGLARALERFTTAIGRDSTFALAYSGVTQAHVVALSLRYSPRDEALSRARSAALRALALDSMLAEAHLAWGQVLEFSWQAGDAEREYARAIALNPNSADAHLRYGRILRNLCGRYEDAVREHLRAYQLDPLSAHIAAQVASSYIAAKHYDRAIAQARKVLELEPNHVGARQYLGEAYHANGLFREAIVAFQTLLEQLGSRGRVMPVLARLGYAHAAAGNRAAALDILARMRARPDDPGYAANVAILYTGLGEKERAFEALEQAYLERDFTLGTIIKWNPYWDPLRADPRFERLLTRIGLNE